MSLEPIIGLEIHVQLKTKSKMFCSCANIFGDVPPNSAICPICLGYPGTLPVPNKTAIEWTQRAGAALHCELATQSKFDRKSYFYPDLPKGYQISQYDQPFCGPGKLEITLNGQIVTIGITRIHLEEDAAKNTHDNKTNATLIDYNRAGTPLMEIVTEPDIRTPEEAKIFLQELQKLMRALDISDADMEKGQLRCDANISLREEGTTELHPKTEVKNINSFKNVERALQYEIKRQTDEWEAGRIPEQSSTRGFNADTGVTTEQRTKEAAADYRYFPEPDIPPFEFSQDDLDLIKKELPELPAAKTERFTRQFSISADQAALLVSNPDVAAFFEDTVSELQEEESEQTGVLPTEIVQLVQLAANVILRQVRTLLEKDGLRYQIHDRTLQITPANFAELIVLLQQSKINNSAVEPILAEMQRTGGEPEAIIANLGLAKESDEGQLLQYVRDVIAGNPDVVEKIKSGKDNALQFLMGQVMAKSQGKADPQVIIALLRKEILG